MLGKHFHRGLETGVHDVLGEGLELGLGGHQLLQGNRVEGVVLGDHVLRRDRGGGIDNRLELRRQGGIGLGVNEELQLGAALPPAGVVVIRRDLVEAELFIVVRADKLDRIERAFFQRLVHVASGHVLRHHAELLHGFAEQAAAHAHFQALEVGDGFDFLAVPAAHLRAGVAGAAALHVVFGVERIHQLAAIAVRHPGVHLAGGQAERHGAAEGENRVFAGEVVRRGLRHLDGAVLQRIDHAKGGHQLASGMHGDFKLAAGQGLDGFGEHFGAAKNGVQRFRKARRQAPANSRLGMHRRRHTGSQHTGEASVFNE